MKTCIYDKTDKGREEIATRKYHVPAKLRTLLVMIDGRHSLESLMKNFAALGLSEGNVEQLLSEEYITLVGGGPAANEPEAEAPSAARAPVSARARMLARNAAKQGKLHGAESQSEGEPDPVDDAVRFRALHGFCHQAAKNALGLRGLPLQLKVEKAAAIGDFRVLRLPLLQAVLKTKGRDTALDLRDRLDELLGGPPEDDDFALPDEHAAPPRRVFDYFNLASQSVDF